MRRFTRLYLDLDATNASAEKVSLLAAYFREAAPADAGVALFFLAGERLDRTASTGLLRRAVLETTGFAEWMLGACYEACGDLSETVALLHPVSNEPSGERLRDTFERRLKPFERASDEGERERILREAWRDFDPDQRFVFHKLIRGGFRVGVQRKTVANALASMTGLDVGLIAQRLTAGIEPTAAGFERIVAPEGAAGDGAAPLPFCLANQLDTPVGGDARAQAVAVSSRLGGREKYQAEWKYDGVRCQLLRHGGETVLWSRGEELVTHQFPEVVSAARGLEECVTLDGEVVLMASGDDVPLAFAELQTRLNRKPGSLVQPGLFDDRGAVFIAYDILRRGGEDLRGLATATRRAVLEEVLGDAAGVSAGGGALRLAPVLGESTWEGLAERREASRARGVEGLMLKHAEAPYHAGRTRADPTWWKWKVDPLSVDAVLIYAQAGSGRRATLFTDYTFGLWETDAETGEAALVPFAKAYSGLTNEEIEAVDRFVRNHTEGKMGPVRKVTPELVFEIGYEGVRRSSRHASGVAVRFPRMLRWRRDKAASEADWLEAVRRQIEGG